MNQCKDCAHNDFDMGDGTHQCARPVMRTNAYVWPDGTCPSWKARPDPWEEEALKAWENSFACAPSEVPQYVTAVRNVAHALKAKFGRHDWGEVWDKLAGHLGWDSAAPVRSEFVQCMRKEVDGE